jgi:predicted permease
MAAYIFGSTVNLTYGNSPQRYTGAYVTENFFRALGVKPAIGRDLTAEDNVTGAGKVALISDKLWRRDFNANSNIVGTAIRLNGKPATIIGVMPPGFAFPSNEDIWIPLFNEFPVRPRNDPNVIGANTPLVLATLRPEISIEQAASEATLFARRLAEQFPDTNKRYNVGRVDPLLTVFSPPQLRAVLYFMLGVCVLVLLLACANVMNMQFARAALRTKELAIRSSLGATRGRLIRQMLTESLLLASIGAVVGVALAFWATDYLQATVQNLPVPIPAYITFSIDKMVLAFVLLATMAAAVVSGVVPAFMASRANAIETLKEGNRGTTNRGVSVVTRVLVIAQIVLTCVILISALLELKSILKTQQVDYGYDTHGLITARMGLMEGAYPDGESRHRFYQRLLREVRASSDIDGAAITQRFRMAFAGNAQIEIEGRAYATDKDRPNVNVENISDGYFTTLGMKLHEGRDFTIEDDDMKLPVAIVNTGFAAKYFGNESALGRRFRTVGNNGQLFGPWRTIVGVVSDVRMLGPFNNPASEDFGFYVPLSAKVFGPAQPAAGPQFATLVVKPRASANASLFANNLRRSVTRVDPDLPLYFIGTPAENIETFLGPNRIIAIMFSIFGAVAMLLAAVGLYGVMSFSVNQRTSEFGIRMALGADNARILQMVLKQGAVQLVVGLALGIGFTLLIAALGEVGIRRQLNFNTNPMDATTYLVVALLLGAVAFVATLVPARRATKVDPLVALRAE